MQRFWRAATWVIALVVLLVVDAAVGQQDPAAPETLQAPPAQAAEPSPPAGKPVDGAEVTSADAATGEDEAFDIRHPLSWWEWGFDVRVREAWFTNGITLDKHHPDHERHRQRQRVRAWSKFTPLDNVEINMRIAWEGNHYDRPLSRENWAPTSTLFDLLNIKLSNIGDSGVTVQLGRQELKKGDGWLIRDGAPLLGSAVAYFDAACLTWELDKLDTTLDFAFIEQDAEEDNWFVPLHDEDRYIVEHDELGAYVWVTNRTLPKTQLEAYSIYTRRTPRPCPPAIRRRSTPLGGRVVHDFTDRLKLSSDLAGQFGRKNGNNLCAWGTLHRLTYQTDDAWRSAFRVDYEYLTGDKPRNRHQRSLRHPLGTLATPQRGLRLRHGWRDPLQRRHQHAPLRTSAGQGHPTEKLELPRRTTTSSSPIKNTFQDLPGFSQGGCFRGQLFTARLTCRFNEYLSGHLLSEFFFPGDYYSDTRNDPRRHAAARGAGDQLLSRNAAGTPGLNRAYGEPPCC